MQTRAGTASDAVMGLTPRLVFEPASTAELAEVALEAARQRLHLAAVGGGTALGLGAAPRALDAVVRTTALSRVLEYAPADMVLIAEAGVPLATLQATAAAHHQRLALDPPHPSTASIGGLVATAASGPLRARYGSIRDLIIGLTLVRADGAITHSGGKVVKNVAGFDLPKVACGSLGTLGLIATATFRLHPLPERSAMVLVPGLTAAQVHRVMVRLRDAQLEHAAAWALRTEGGRYELAISFEGFAAGVAQQLTALEGVVREAKVDFAVLDPEAERAVRRRHDDLREQPPLRVRVSAVPSKLELLDGLLAPVLAALSSGGFTWYPTVGLGWLGGEVADSTAAQRALATARQHLAAERGALVIEHGPALIDPWGARPESFPLMERLKKNFDPEGRLNPGRYVGGL